LESSLLSWSAGEPAALAGLCKHAEALVINPGADFLGKGGEAFVAQAESTGGGAPQSAKSAAEREAFSEACREDLAAAQHVFESVLEAYPNHAAALASLTLALPVDPADEAVFRVTSMYLTADEV
jgi:hypothetical protein